MAITLYKGRTSSPASGQPLIFTFHGTGGDEHQFFTLALGLVPGAGVISPRGDVLQEGSLRFLEQIDTQDPEGQNNKSRADRMLSYVRAHIAAHPGHPVFGFGYSNGANMLATITLRQPDLFDRIALLHPSLAWEMEQIPALDGLRVLVTTGMRDQIASAQTTNDLVSALRFRKAKVTSDTHDGGQELRQSEIGALRTFFTQ